MFLRKKSAYSFGTMRVNNDIFIYCILYNRTCLEKVLTLNSVGTMSFGVSTPIRASTPQKIKMARIMAKSLISFLT